MDTITVTIPSDWLEGESVSQDDLRQALKLGLTQLRQQQSAEDTTERVIQALLRTGQIKHLSAKLVDDEGQDSERQAPPSLPGPAVSEILIAQRRGAL
jgi:hypothetical protein